MTGVHVRTDKIAEQTVEGVTKLSIMLASIDVDLRRELASSPELSEQEVCEGLVVHRILMMMLPSMSLSGFVADFKNIDEEDTVVYLRNPQVIEELNGFVYSSYHILGLDKPATFKGNKEPISNYQDRLEGTLAAALYLKKFGERPEHVDLAERCITKLKTIKFHRQSEIPTRS